MIAQRRAGIARLRAQNNFRHAARRHGDDAGVVFEHAVHRANRGVALRARGKSRANAGDWIERADRIGQAPIHGTIGDIIIVAVKTGGMHLQRAAGRHGRGVHHGGGAGSAG